MKQKGKKLDLRSKIFSILNNDIICECRNDLLPYMPATPLHNHDGYEILLFLNGTANYCVESEAKYLERGEVVLTAPYAFHCTDASQSERYERIFINIKEPFMKSLCSSKSDLRTCFSSTPTNMLNSILLNEDEISEFIELSKKLRHHLYHSEFGNDLIIPALLTQLLILLNKKSISKPPIEFESTMPKIVSDTIALINDNLQDDITMKMLSDDLHHNSDYLCRCFKKTVGMNIQQFIIAKRLTLAQKYLRESKSASDACFLAGFSDYSNFSRTFSKHLGMSPKQYQKQYTVLQME